MLAVSAFFVKILKLGKIEFPSQHKAGGYVECLLNKQILMHTYYLQHGQYTRGIVIYSSRTLDKRASAHVLGETGHSSPRFPLPVPWPANSKMREVNNYHITLRALLVY